MREEVLAEFRKQNTRLRLVIATSAFGLGVDCPDIGRVINWGAPNITEELEQQSGRAGRDDSQAEAILYYKKQENTFPKPQKNMVAENGKGHTNDPSLIISVPERANNR
ncbi:ATP-dependent DNA helicase Q1-like [Dysidea avara]|uniref:ATP-dependent DNA helicase Q1-like n=1 Tax=Dysidea avara TaxID=196820 RepID=UPI00332EB1B9